MFRDVEGVPSGRAFHSSFLIGTTRLFVFGGFDGRNELNDLHALDVSPLANSLGNLPCNATILHGTSDLHDLSVLEAERVATDMLDDAEPSDVILV